MFPASFAFVCWGAAVLAVMIGLRDRARRRAFREPWDLSRIELLYPRRPIVVVSFFLALAWFVLGLWIAFMSRSPSARRHERPREAIRVILIAVPDASRSRL
jgi:hypothetical protein